MGTKNLNSATDLITFTRASSSTFLGSNGLIQTATNNTPRIEYNADGTVKGLLIEKQRTNSVTYSEQTDNSAWTKAVLTVTANASVAPDGLLTADKIVEASSGSAQHNMRQVVNVTANTTYTASVFAKSAERFNLRFGLLNSGLSSGAYAQFNLNTGVISGQVTAGTATNISYSIEPVGNGFYRCSVAVTVDNSSTSITPFIGLLDDSGNASYSGDGASGLYIWGAQLEQGSFPTSYIPTTGATATRAADNASIPTSAFGYNDNAGTVVVTASVERSVTQGGTGIFTLNTILNSNTSNGGMGSFYRASNTLGINVWNSSGTSVLDKTPTGDVDNRTITLAFAIKKDDFAIVTDYDQTVLTDTSGQLPAPITVLQLGKWVNDGDILCGHIKSIKYYPRRLSNTQLQELTT